jgi:D-3-phosphoglycerate dehydrogenase
MAGEAGKQRVALLATEKAFAAEAVDKIEAVFKTANYTLKKLEGYKSKEELLAAVKEVDAMIIRSDIVDEAVIAAADKLKIVVRAGAGYDNIDLKATAAKEVCAMNTPGQNANAVAELVFAMMLTSARNSFDGSSGFEISGRSIAFYGFGAVARAVHKLCIGFGMKTFAYDPFIPADAIRNMGAEPVETVAGLFEHQYVSLHVPLTDQTKESINKELLSKMPKGGTLINTARPEVINEADMLEVIKTRSDFCYLSDVTPKNADAIREAVGDKFMKRVIFTKKKMGAQTIEANNNAGVAAANQIVGFFEKGDVKFALKA